MSGGSWDYVYSRVDDAACRLMNSDTPERVALGKILKLAARALHDIEWVDSSDYGEGDEREAIEKVVSRQEIASAATDLLLAKAKELRVLLDKIEAAP